MPSLITHQLLGKEVIRNVDSHLEKIIRENFKEFSIGTSGPDIFFYYNAWPWNNQEEMKRVYGYGSTIHSNHINDFFKVILEDLKNHQDQQRISYVAGLLCHWALDKTAHPYIFYKTMSADPSKHYHQMFESNVDALMLRIILNKDVKDYPPHKIVEYNKNSDKIIFQTYEKAMEMVHHIQIDQKTITQAMKNFYDIQKFIYSPSGIKRTLFFQFEKVILKNPHCFTCMVIPPNNKTEYDFLNEKRSTWHHPCTNASSNKSFLDLFNESIGIGQTILELLMAYLRNKIEIEEVLAYLNNQTFDTGLSVASKMKYYDCIFEKNENL